jgi:hypothetical protein
MVLQLRRTESAIRNKAAMHGISLKRSTNQPQAASTDPQRVSAPAL